MHKCKLCNKGHKLKVYKYHRKCLDKKLSEIFNNPKGMRKFAKAIAIPLRYLCPPYEKMGKILEKSMIKNLKIKKDDII